MASNDILIVGYQANSFDIEKGMLLFNHSDAKCGTTLAILVDNFLDLDTGHRYDQPKLGTAECEERCLNDLDIQRCNAKCRFAYVREIMQFFRQVT